MIFASFVPLCGARARRSAAWCCGRLGRPTMSKDRTSQLYEEPQLPPSWDWVVIVLTWITLGALGFEWAYDLEVTDPQLWRYLQWGDNAVCAVFITEFGIRLRRAPRRVEFVRRNWIDLLGAVPMIDALRGARLVRFIRVLRVTRFFLVWRRIARRYDLPIPKGALTNLGLTTLGIWLASAAAFYRLEGGRPGVESFDDALWWSMTTLSTVGYGDLYPETPLGRAVAVLTMVLGIGLLGTVAATTATVFMDWRDRGKKGLRRYVVRDHLLVLGWNEKAIVAIENFRSDPRHQTTDIVVVADEPEKPLDDPDVRFVRGSPGRTGVLQRASAAKAGAAIVFAAAPDDPRSDHESALIVTNLRRVNKTVRIAAELVDYDNREHLIHAGCDALIDETTTIANLLVRSVQDIGVSDVVCELLSSKVGSELYRAPVPSDWRGKSYRDFAREMIDRGMSVIGVARAGKNLLNPEPQFTLDEGDDVFLVANEPPCL
jgi:voltage-gated potassium channel